MLFSVKNINIYQTNFSVHGINTMQQNKAHIPSVRLSSIQKVVCYSSVKIFNQLPQNTSKYCNNTHTFKTSLTDYIVKNSFIPLRNIFSVGYNDVEI